MPEKLGYIGLGVMGLPVMRHLCTAGHQLAVYDRDADVLQAAGESDAVTSCGSVAEVVAQADVVFTCLPTVAAVESVYAEIQRPGLLCCDNSTIGPAAAVRLHGELRARGIGYVECPMLGGGREAEAGELFLLLSGAPEEVERVLPLVKPAARGLRVVGPPGSANLFKVVQNALGLAQLTAMAEALTVLTKGGGDPAAFIEVVMAGKGMAASPLFEARAPSMCVQNPPVSGTLRIGAKDSGLGAELAEQVGVAAPVLRESALAFARAMADGLGDGDISGIARVVEGRSAVRLNPPEA